MTEQYDGPEGAPTYDYDVGYKKPPKEHQFQKGQSANPSGRRPGCKNLRTLILAELARTTVVKENGRSQTITNRQAWAKRLVHDAIVGVPRADAALLKVVGDSEIREDDKGRFIFIIEE